MSATIILVLLVNIIKGANKTTAHVLIADDHTHRGPVATVDSLGGDQNGGLLASDSGIDSTESQTTPGGVTVFLFVSS